MSDAPAPEGAGPVQGAARFAARWFDGRTAESREVGLELGPAGVIVTPADDAARLWGFDELVLVRGGRPAEPVQLERRSTPMEVLVVADDRFLELLRAALPAGTRLAHAGAGPIRAKFVLGLVAAAAAVLAVAYLWVVPSFSRFVADRVPEAWERSFGDAVLAQLDVPQQKVTEPRIVASAAGLHSRLIRASRGRVRASRLLVVRSDQVNAFAVPGGTVVVTTGLLRALRAPEELAAVIAHELGHVGEHHPMRAVARQLSMGALLGLIAGDQSALSGALRTAGDLGGLAYSRDDERAADDLATALLARVGLSPAALADALESIMEAAPRTAGVSFLSTHPAPSERIERIRAAARTAAEPRETSTYEQVAWRVMKRALADSGR